MIPDTACGAFAPSSETPIATEFRVRVPVQVRAAARLGSGAPTFLPAAADGDAEAEGFALGVPGPPAK